MRRTYGLYETISGSPTGFPIFAPESDWRVTISQHGNGSFTIPIPRISRFTPEQWHDATRHWWSTIVEFHDNVPMYAGLIADKEWDDDREVLTVDTVTVSALWQDRYTFGVSGYGADNYSITSQTERAAIMQAIQRGVYHSTLWSLPFDYLTPTNEAGGFSKTWATEDFATIANVIDQISSGVIGGIDVVYRPKIVNNLLRYDVAVGNPRVDGPTIDLPLSVRKSRVTGLRVREAGSDMLTGLFGKGEGYGDERPVAEAGFRDAPPMPIRDAAIDFPADDSTVQVRTDATLDARLYPALGKRFTLHHGDDLPLPLADLKLGARFNARYSGSGYLPPATTTEYLVGLSYSTSAPDQYTPEVVTL